MPKTTKRPAASPTRSAPAPPRTAGRRAAGDVVMGYVAVQVARLIEAEPLVRGEGPDGVHQMRVALRRLRSVLGSYRPMFDRSVTEPLRSELTWLGGVLSPVRDLDVLRARLTERLRADGHADMLVRAQVERQLVTRRAAALVEVRWVLDGERYQTLLATLQSLLTSPPLTGEAARAASKVLPRRVARSWRQVQAAVAAAGEPGLDVQTRTLRWHEARKKAKRARYAAEVARPLAGRPAKQFVRAMKGVQTVLGNAQDGAVSVRELEGLAPGVDNAFSLGRAQVLEERRIAGQVGAFTAVWRKASRRRLRRWLR